ADKPADRTRQYRSASGRTPTTPHRPATPHRSSRSPPAAPSPITPMSLWSGGGPVVGRRGRRPRIIRPDRLRWRRPTGAGHALHLRGREPKRRPHIIDIQPVGRALLALLGLPPRQANRSEE